MQKINWKMTRHPIKSQIHDDVQYKISISSSRRTWRISSVYACLATWSSLTNLLCIIRYASILHSTTRNLLHRWVCQIYELSFSFRVISSWITLFGMFERVTCLSTRIRTLSKHCCSLRLQFSLG